MKSTKSQATAVPYRPKKAELNWVDYLVIGATIATFAIVVAVNNPHVARAQTRSTVIISTDLPSQSSQAREDAGLIKAKIGLATTRPWG